MKGRAGGCLREGVEDCDPRLEVGGRESNRFHLCGCDSPGESFCWPFSFSEGKYCSPHSLPLPPTPGLALLSFPVTQPTVKSQQCAVDAAWKSQVDRTVRKALALRHLPFTAGLLEHSSMGLDHCRLLYLSVCQQVPAPGEEYGPAFPNSPPLVTAIGWMTDNTPIAQDAQGSASTVTQNRRRQTGPAARQESILPRAPWPRPRFHAAVILHTHTHTLKGGKVQEGTERRIK